MQVAGYAVGGGHVLHMVCDLTIAADNAIFGQTGPKVLILCILKVSSFVGVLHLADQNMASFIVTISL